MAASDSSRTVLVALHEPSWKGATAAVASVAELLPEHGWRPVFWMPGGRDGIERLPPGAAVVDAGERPFRYSLRELRQPPGAAARVRAAGPYLRDFGALIRRLRPDVVHANTVLALPEAAVARALGTGVLLHCHEQLGRDAKSLVAARAAALLADRVVAVSDAAAAAFPSGARAAVVRNGVPRRDPAGAAGDSDGRPVVMTVGTVCRRKGSDLFAAVARATREAVPEAEFWHVGALAEGAESAWARAVVQEGERSGVRYLGHRDDVEELYGRASLLLFPSREDPFPLTVLEAMAAGLPVLGTRVGGIPEQIGSEAGILVAAEDADGLARLTIGLLRDGDRRRRLGRHARERAEREFSIDRQAAELAEQYAAAARGARRR